MLIGEVARRSGVSARMLRHYDRLGLVRPSGRTAGGYRDYVGADVARIAQVESLRALGLSLADVGRALDGEGLAPTALVDELIARTRARLDRDRELLGILERVREAGAATWDGVLSAAPGEGSGPGPSEDEQGRLEGTLRLVALLRAQGEEYASARQRAALMGDALPPGALAEAALAEDDVNAAGALRWALERSPSPDLGTLAAALDSTDAGLRERAVRAAENLPGAEELLRRGLRDPAEAVRTAAGLALAAPGRRGDLPAAERRRRFTELLPLLVDAIVRGPRDVDAAEALAGLASEAPARARAVRALEQAIGDAGVRRRIAQALAEVPGPAADAALRRLAEDAEPGVALTARAVLRGR